MNDLRAGVFLSYRRADSKPWTGRLAGDLRDYFGEDRVYLDLDSNRGGQDYVVQIEDALASSKAVVAVLGPSWLGQLADGRSRRIDSPEDMVRQELERALGSGIAIVTVVVGAAAVPSADQLPISLKRLSRIQALRMSDEDWTFDFARLVEALERHGLYPRAPEEQEPVEWKATKASRYQRVVSATRRRAFDAVASTVQAFNYKDHQDFPEAAQVKFRVAGRQIVVKVLDDEPGKSVVVVEFPTLKATVLGAGAVAAAVLTSGLAIYALPAWPALRLLDRRFAKGFLENVSRVLDGKGIGDDPALLPGVAAWRNRTPNV